MLCISVASYPGHAKKKKKNCLVSIVCACARIYGIGSVNVSVNGLSHMPRSSTEILYGTLRLSTTEMAVKLGEKACNNLSAMIIVAILP